MSDLRSQDEVLGRFRAELERIYGQRLDRVVLFGSRARGEAAPDADYDVAVFLKTLPDRMAERMRLADLRAQFLDDAGVFFDVLPFLSDAWDERSPLMHEIRRDGQEV